MRAAAIGVAMLALCACADDKLAVNPPKGVDFSGQWKINEADSDDPQHLAQVANGTASNTNTNTPPQATRRGRGGGGGVPGGYQGPAPPPVGVMSASLRWPGQAVEIKQVAGVVAFASDGRNRVCQPGAAGAGKKHRHHDDDLRDRNAMPSGREAPPPMCGWSERTLVVQAAESEDERPPFEEEYSLSEDGARLIEVVMFKGGRSDGYTLSRVWDRVQK